MFFLLVVRECQKGERELTSSINLIHHFVENIGLKKNVVMFKLGMDDI